MGAVETRLRANARAPSLRSETLEERELGENRARLRERLTSRDWLALLVVGGSFVATSVFLLEHVQSSRSRPLWETVFVTGVYAFVSRLEYEVGAGSVVPTQLILVPMLFIFPLGQVPLIVLSGLLAGAAIDVGLGRMRPQRVGLTVMDGWHVIGPVCVLALAGEGPPDLHDAPIYVSALLAQFVVEFVSFAARDWISRGVDPRAQLFYTLRTAPIDLALAPLGLAVAFPARSDPLAILLVVPLIWLLRMFAQERRSRVDSALELSDAYRGTAFLLGDVVEADDEYTGMHSRDVVTLSVAVAREIGLDERGLRDTELTALLHDVGKIRVPGEIINKPAALTHGEREVIDTHTIVGEEMLAQVGGVLGTVGHLVRSCHERWDGAGYPDGLAGDEIPLIARIVSCCDAFSAMTTHRSYRPAMDPDEALEELLANSGGQFDPGVATTLYGLVVRGEVERPL